MSITIVNPQCGEVVYTLNTAVVCGNLPDHRHCSPSDCPEGLHDGAAHCIVERGPERTAAVQVQKIEIRKHAFTSSTSEPVDGKINHIEARGLVAIEGVPVTKDPTVCARSTHHHVTVVADAYDIERGIAPGTIRECCVIPEYYPITVHLDLPVGDGCQTFLGDNLIVTVRRAYGRLEHQYKVE